MNSPPPAQTGADAAYGLSEVLKQGWVLKQSRHLQDWRRRWLVLTATHVLSFVDSNLAAGKPTEVVELGSCKTVRSYSNAKYKHGFELITDETTLRIVTNTLVEKENWIALVGKQSLRSLDSYQVTEENIIY